MRRKRCAWAGGGSAAHPLMLDYHDREWGVPVHEDRLLFEFLVLEGAQAGLSWLTVLKKRARYREVFDRFEPDAVAGYSRGKVRQLLQDPGIIRNRRKIESAVANAGAVLEIQREFGSLDEFLWRFVGGRPRINRWRGVAELPASTPESTDMSRELRRRGFRFVGPTICYAFMQAVGMVNDHVLTCFRYRELGGA